MNACSLRWITAVWILIGSAAGIAAAAGVQRAPLDMLGRLEPGRWELRMRETGVVQRLCLGGPGMKSRIVQIKHPDLECDRLVLEDLSASITVQYTCRGHGYGRTHVRKETSQLVQIESQGIADGLPFEFSAEGRRIGDCPG